MRPTGCSTWAFARRSTGSSPRVRRSRQTLFFSATLDGEAGTPRRALRAPTRWSTSTARPSAARERRDRAPVRARRARAPRRGARPTSSRRDRDLTLVFVRTKHGADRLVKRLAAHGVKAVAMHGNKSQRQRERALARFESGAVDTLVATDVAARGIDVERISHVINFDPPGRQRDLRAPDRPHRPRRRARASASRFVTPTSTHDVTKLAGQLGLDHGLHKPTAGHARPRPSAHQHQAGARSRQRPNRRRTPSRG